MTLSFYDTSVQSYLQILNGLIGVLDKGLSHAEETGLDLVVSARDTLAEYDPAAIESLADDAMVFKLGKNELPFTNRNFLLSFSLPNFYFHATTSYSILLMLGVPLGKIDYIGQMKIGAASE